MTAESDLNSAFQKVGRFLYHFARLEHEIDDGISKLLKIEEGAIDIIAANVDFGRKVSILCSAEAHLATVPAAQRKQRAMKLRSAVMSLNDKRKIVAHCVFQAGEGGSVVFRRATATTNLKIESLNWSEGDFQSSFDKLEETAAAIRDFVATMEPYSMSTDFSDPRNSALVAALGM